MPRKSKTQASQPPRPAADASRVVNCDLPRQGHATSGDFIETIDAAKCPTCGLSYTTRMHDPNAAQCQECRSDSFAEYAEQFGREAGARFDIGGKPISLAVAAKYVSGSEYHRFQVRREK